MKRLRNVDLLLYLFPCLLWLIGCAVLWSLTFASPDINVANLALRQAIFGLIGLIACFGLTLMDYRVLKQFVWFIAAATVLLLAAVEYFGTTSLGATRWLDLKVFQLQPSEITKVVLVIVLSFCLVPYVERVSAKVVLIVAAVLALPLYLVMKQPDLGTAILLVLSALGIVLSLHLRRRHVIALGVMVTIASIVGLLAYGKIRPFDLLLHNYQRDRIYTFLNPQSDPLGKGYNVRQAELAMGNGGLLGRGLGKEVGQLSQLNFLPKAYTDFIFAALGEALGFVGAGVVLILFAGMLWRLILAAQIARDSFGTLVCYGIFSILTFSVLINVGMNLGIMPVTGIPLPFISSGGTALIMNFVAIGIVQSIVSRRQPLSFD